MAILRVVGKVGGSFKVAIPALLAQEMNIEDGTVIQWERSGPMALILTVPKITGPRIVKTPKAEAIPDPEKFKNEREAERDQLKDISQG